MEQKKIEEFVEKAQRAKSQEEIEAAAKECGLELTAEKLAKLEEVLRGKKGELTDEELAAYEQFCEVFGQGQEPEQEGQTGGEDE